MKKILAILALFIFVCILALTSFILLMDPNQLKPVMIAEVMQKTGYKMRIDGKLSLSFYPRLAILIKRISLTTPNDTKPFLELEHIQLATTLSQLLHANKKWQGELRIANLRLLQLHAADARIGLNWQGKTLSLQPIQINFYQGKLSGIAHGRDFSTIPHWDLQAKATEVQVQPLLRDVLGVNSIVSITGSAQIASSLEMVGQTKTDILSHLNGVLDFSIANGAVEGVDINYLIQSADALLHKQPLPQLPVSGMRQTNFDHFSALLTIKNGVAETNNLMLLSSALIGTGQGSVNLNQQTLDLKLQAKPRQAQWEVPVIISGKTMQPEVKLDMIAIQKLVISQDLDKIKTKAREEIEKHVPGKAGEFLKNLIGK